MNQISMFELVDDLEKLTAEEKMFEDILDHGGHTEESLLRIKTNVHLPLNDFIPFLRHEFGIGGVCYSGYHLWWDEKGIKVGENFEKMKLYPWNAVAKAFKRKYE